MRVVLTGCTVSGQDVLDAAQGDADTILWLAAQQLPFKLSAYERRTLYHEAQAIRDRGNNVWRTRSVIT